MDELISLIDKGTHGGRLHIYEVGIHNMKDKEYFSEDNIEQIAQTIKEKIIEEMTKNIL